MTIQVRQYTNADAQAWDDLVDHSWNGTFLHTRRFLSYHGGRFSDKSLIIEDEKKHIVGVFPAALNPEASDCVVSHPGITYGSIVHAGDLRGARMLEALEQICDFYRQTNITTLIYKAVPYIYHRVPASDDLYALFRLSAVRYRCDLSASINLYNRNKLSQRRIRSLSKAQKNKVFIDDLNEDCREFWSVLQDNLVRKHNMRPVHSLDEISFLHSMFPYNIQFVVGKLDGVVVAGVVLFKTQNVIHAQYIASSQRGQEVSALDAVFDRCINLSKLSGVHYFNFGVSTENSGQYLNDGLHQFKTEFGGGGVVHEFYKIALI